MPTRRSQGSIAKKGSLYYGVADLGRDPRGKRARKWTRGFAKKRDAERALAALVANGTPSSPSSGTVASVVRDYVDAVEALGRQRTTIVRYRGLLKNNIEPTLGSVRVSTLRADRVDRAYRDLLEGGLSRTSVSHVNGLLVSSFRWAMKKGRLGRDPMLGVDAPKRTRSRATALRAESARAWLASLATSRWLPLFLFSLATGTRRGETLALRREQVDRERAIVVVVESLAEVPGEVYRKSTKPDRVREIPLSPLALTALDAADAQRIADRAATGAAWEDHDLVFADQFGRRIRPQSFTDAFRNSHPPQGTTLHSLRHTAATWLLSGGADVYTTSSILGHSEATTTLRTYAHVVAERQRSAVDLIGDALAGVRTDRFVKKTAEEAAD